MIRKFPLISYFFEVIGEMKKVVWPKPKEVIRLTGLVIIISLVVSLYLGGLDLSFTKLLESILK